MVYYSYEILLLKVISTKYDVKEFVCNIYSQIYIGIISVHSNSLLEDEGIKTPEVASTCCTAMYGRLHMLAGVLCYQEFVRVDYWRFLYVIVGTVLLLFLGTVQNPTILSLERTSLLRVVVMSVMSS